jgi:hypothetical protein
MNELERLHVRLTSDMSNPFTTVARDRIKKTVLGKAWMSDYADYQQLYRNLEADGVDVPRALNERFGYLIDEEDA